MPLTDATINTLIQAFQTVALAFISAWGGYKLAVIAKTSKDGHDLANNFMLEMKRKLMVATEKNVLLEPNDSNKAIAQEAKDTYDAHKEIDDRMKMKGK